VFEGKYFSFSIPSHTYKRAHAHKTHSMVFRFDIHLLLVCVLMFVVNQMKNKKKNKKGVRMMREKEEEG
jgi:hypothetical protein